MIMLMKGIGDLNTQVIVSLLHLKADLNPELVRSCGYFVQWGTIIT